MLLLVLPWLGATQPLLAAFASPHIQAFFKDLSVDLPRSIPHRKTLCRVVLSSSPSKRGSGGVPSGGGCPGDKPRLGRQGVEVAEEGEACRGTPAWGSLLLSVGCPRTGCSHGPGGSSAPVTARALGGGCAMGLPWVSHGSRGLFPSRRQGRGSGARLLPTSGAGGVWSVPEDAPAPGFPVVRASKLAEAPALQPRAREPTARRESDVPRLLTRLRLHQPVSCRTG